LPNDAPVTDVSANATVTANIGTRFGFMLALPYRFQLGSDCLASWLRSDESTLSAEN
jgi:hypothetical protein